MPHKIILASILLVFVCALPAHLQEHQEKMAQVLQQIEEEQSENVVKRALEYPMGANDDNDHVPSCAELRAIWQLTKRAARHSLLTNEIPTDNYFGYVLRSPLPLSASGQSSNGISSESFGRIILEPNSKHGARSRHQGVYGHPVPPRLGTGFDGVAQQLRTGGIFTDRPFRLRKWSIKDRPIKPRHHFHDYIDFESTSRGDRAYGYRHPQKASLSLKPKTKPSLELKAAADHIIRQALAEMAAADQVITYGRDAGSGNRGHDVAAIGFSADHNACGNAATKTCHSNADCACLGFYACARGRCKSYKSTSARAPESDLKSRWHDRAQSNNAQTVVRHKRRKVAPPDNDLLQP